MKKAHLTAASKAKPGGASCMNHMDGTIFGRIGYKKCLAGKKGPIQSEM